MTRFYDETKKLYEVSDWSALVVAVYKSDFFEHIDFLRDKFQGRLIYYLFTSSVDNFLLITTIYPSAIHSEIKIRNIWIHTTFKYAAIHGHYSPDDWQSADSIDHLINLMKVTEIIES